MILATTAIDSLLALSPIFILLVLIAIFGQFLMRKQKKIIDRNMEYLHENNAALKEISAQLKRIGDSLEKNQKE